MRPSSCKAPWRSLCKKRCLVVSRDSLTWVGRYLVFHGGSGSTKEEIATAVGNGVVKMNVDTDTQYAYLIGIRVSWRETVTAVDPMLSVTT